MKTAKAISGWECITDCGDGNLVLPNSIRCPASRAVYRSLVKTPMARSLSAGKAKFIGSSREKLRSIHFQVLRDSLRPTGYSVIAMAACGSEPGTAALCMYTMEGPMCLLRRTVYQPKALVTISFRIGKAAFGQRPLTAWIDLAPSRRLT